MKFSDEEYNLLYKKLEYRFKNSDNELVDKIKEHENLSTDDIILLLKKLEYTFRKSDNDIIKKLTELSGIENYSPIKYSNLSAKKRRDNKKLNEHVLSFENFIKNGKK